MVVAIFPVPLNPLRVFVLASRYPTFVEAAQKLNVTPGAISRQVKVLEAYLGIELYSNGANSKHLTEAGRTYAEMLGPCIDDIENRNAIFVNRNHAHRLRLACSNHLLRQWLLPRLGRFLDAHPELEFSFDVLKPGLDADRQADIWIRYGKGDWPEFNCIEIMRPQVTPVCSPAYLEKHGRPAHPDDLEHHTLLHSVYRPDDWNAWFAATGITSTPVNRFVSFGGTYLAYQAALMGSGIALGRIPMLKQDLSNGSLIRLFPVQAEVDSAFFLCTPRGGPNKRSVHSFVQWITSEAKDNT